MSARDVLIRELDEQQGLNAPEARTDAILSALSAAGYAVVPREPTPEMCSMGADELPTPTCESPDADAASEVYCAMIAASEPTRCAPTTWWRRWRGRLPKIARAK